MSNLPSRLYPIAKLIFDSLNKSGSQGIIFGGAAAAMNGSTRQTKAGFIPSPWLIEQYLSLIIYLIQDVDIDVTAFPKIENSDIVKVKGPDSNKMMKVSYLAIENQAVKCDIGGKRVDLMPLFLRHSITDEAHGITCASPSLLLADKISTVADRGDRIGTKRVSDMEDITFCIQKMYDNSEKMPSELKNLYTAAEWRKVLFELDYVDDGAYFKEVATELEIGYDPEASQ
jgi:hypothetical protein